jgi:hypothetical protein
MIDFSTKSDAWVARWWIFNLMIGQGCVIALGAWLLPYAGIDAFSYFLGFISVPILLLLVVAIGLKLTYSGRHAGTTSVPPELK